MANEGKSQLPSTRGVIILTKREGPHIPRAKRSLPTDTLGSETSEMETRPSKQLKVLTIAEEAHTQASEVPGTPEGPEVSEGQLATSSPAPALSAPIVRRISPPEPKKKWTKQLFFELANGASYVQYYKPGSDKDNAGDCGQTGVPRELVDEILLRLDPKDFKTIFVERSKLRLPSQDAEHVLGYSLVRKFLKREGVPLQTLYFPDPPEHALVGALNPFDVFCVVLGYGCQVCQGSIVIHVVCWGYPLRICEMCSKKHIIDYKAAFEKLQQAGFAHANRIKRVLECIVYMQGSGKFQAVGKRKFHDAAVDALIHDYNDFEAKEGTDGADTFNDWFQDKQTFQVNRLSCTRIIAEWQSNAKRSHKVDVQAGRKQRIQDIRTQAAAMQPPISRRELINCQSYQNQFSISEPLTHRSWKILSTKLLRETRTAHINNRARTYFTPPIQQDLLQKCPSYHSSIQTTYPLTEDALNALFTSISIEAQTLVVTAVQTHHTAIRTMNPHFFTTTPPSLLAKSVTWQEQLQLGTQWALPPVLPSMAFQHIAARVWNEVNTYINGQRQARLGRILDAIRLRDPAVDEGMLNRCSVFRAQRQFWGTISREEVDVVVDMVLGQIGILRQMWGHGGIR